ncbi:hypothetical protein [Pedobacter psychrodurus]|uniref:hypothetical protein n=1 Tax=Pedobacter psychrodurus TaxID=2530456 RepID=UPI0029317310|nr:hypothetical protein [Pedobacter psychrodurus]
MKKLFLIALVTVMATGCSVRYYEPKFNLGMTEQDFKNSNRSATQVYGDEKDMLIYRTYNQFTETYTFFRFSKAKLVQFGEGVYPDDYKLLPLQQ